MEFRKVLMKKRIAWLACLSLISGSAAFAANSSFYKWGSAYGGNTYCYEVTRDGRVLNEGQPVDEQYCIQSKGITYGWGSAYGGSTYCYKYTLDGQVLNGGQPVDDSNCKR